ncbi:hypothetical protein AeMF1_012770 [Aphanomyces euteiches]|nr:hypothetical protein AeMF1_012770 [Aphanomyces euteiches]KAH9192044.1 hypothetical protein AeNC1_005989 [Aphanomyces euteiches]
MVALLVLLAVAALATGQSLQGRCSSDADCGGNATCVTVDTGRSSFSKCTSSSPVCGGRTFGHCPSQDSEVGNMMCLFVETKKIRNVQCCSSSGQQTATSSPSGTTAPSTASTNATRLLQEDTCFECYKPTGSNRTIAGSFQCILKDQCKQQSVFPAVCSTGLSCDTDKTTLCSKHGTCAPIDRDAPQGTYRCLCDVGFGGRFCDQVISNDCVGDCGVGGTCVSGQCVCNVGYTGDQCMGCTRNQTCNSDKLAGSCNLKTNTCDCNPGYQGMRSPLLLVVDFISLRRQMVWHHERCHDDDRHMHDDVPSRLRHARYLPPESMFLPQWSMRRLVVYEMHAPRSAACDVRISSVV